MIARLARLLTLRRIEKNLAKRKAARPARREAAEAALSAEWKRRGDAARAYAERIGL